ncbi:unnamed protein product [Blepharisma stoltei]|uniref:EF-hand domain-containing protein n=1 Tax=Blepharisma stoltei TaxID=1481888 RepID=A0AAU9IUW9_9CILI|nr:unnamed protein product [Blepharisma stoltei]
MAQKYRKNQIKIPVLKTDSITSAYSISHIKNLKSIEEVKENENYGPSFTHAKRGLSNRNPAINPQVELPLMHKDFGFFQKFFDKLKNHPEVYQYFKRQACQKGILIKKIQTYRENSTSLSKNRYNSPHNENKRSQSSIHDMSITDRRFTRNNKQSVENISVLYTEPDRKSHNISLDIITPNMGKSKIYKKNKFASKQRRKGVFTICVDRSRPEVFSTFKVIAKDDSMISREIKLSSENLKEYLLNRYPSEMVEAILKYFYLDKYNFNKWLVEIEKIINYPDEKILKFCFDLYDFNKDNFICYHDAYCAMSADALKIFEKDVLKLREAMNTKKAAGSESKKSIRNENDIRRRVSYLNTGDTEQADTSLQFPTNKPEALSLPEFSKIFTYFKPHIFDDIMSYLLGYSINNSYHKDLTPKAPERRPSEEILMDILSNEDRKREYESQTNYSYYNELEKAMFLYNTTDRQLLLEKFEMMRCPSFKNQKLISLNSILENLPKIFGAKCDHVSKCFYNYLSGPGHRDITKPSFLMKCYVILKEEPSKFAFSIYDRNSDGLLTCDEINDMIMSLPQNTPIYEECQVLVNEFLSSIFGRRRAQLLGIDYQLFCDLIPNSLFIQEFSQSLLTPQNSLPRKNLSFTNKIC